MEGESGRYLLSSGEPASRLEPFSFVYFGFCFGEGLENELREAKEATRLAQASITVEKRATSSAHGALEDERRDHTALKEAVDFTLQTLGAEPSSSRLGRLSALGGQVRDRLRDTLHLGVKCAMAVISSRYKVNLELISDGYVVGEEHEDYLEEEIARLNAAAEEPRKALVTLFEDEVVSPSEEDEDDL